MNQDIIVPFEGINFNAEDVAADPVKKFVERTKPQFWPELDEPAREAKLKAVHELCTSKVAEANKKPAPEPTPEKPAPETKK